MFSPEICKDIIDIYKKENYSFYYMTSRNEGIIWAHPKDQTFNPQLLISETHFYNKSYGFKDITPISYEEAQDCLIKANYTEYKNFVSSYAFKSILFKKLLEKYENNISNKNKIIEDFPYFLDNYSHMDKLSYIFTQTNTEDIFKIWKAFPKTLINFQTTYDRCDIEFLESIYQKRDFEEAHKICLYILNTKKIEINKHEPTSLAVRDYLLPLYKNKKSQLSAFSYLNIIKDYMNNNISFLDKENILVANTMIDYGNMKTALAIPQYTFTIYQSIIEKFLHMIEKKVPDISSLTISRIEKSQQFYIFFRHTNTNFTSDKLITYIKDLTDFMQANTNLTQQLSKECMSSNPPENSILQSYFSNYFLNELLPQKIESKPKTNKI